jgi:hypothetical protein
MYYPAKTLHHVRFPPLSCLVIRSGLIVPANLARSRR